MKAVGLYRFGQPDVLQVVEMPRPVPPPGSMLIAVAAAAVNPTDATFRRGGYSARLETRARPLVPGFDFAGRVEAVGPDARRGLTVGDPVVGLAAPLGSWSGAYAEYVIADERSVVRAPAGVSLVEASTLLLNGLTATIALDRLGIRPGGSLLITGAAGAVGGYAVQLAHRRGLRTVALGGEPDEAILSRWGADHVVRRGADAVRDVLELYPGGVDGVVDAADLRDDVTRALAPGGALASLKGWAAPLSEATVVPIVATAQATNTILLQGLVGAAARREVQLRVGAKLPYARAADAHRLLEQGGVRGRIVLQFSPA